MHNFKQAFVATLCFVLLFALISIAVLMPYFRSEVDYFQDAQLREDLSGQITCLALGASHALTAFDTEILDEKLGCFSYNLSGSMMTLGAKYYLLEKELERNPVSTVFLEISYDTLTRKEDKEFAIGDEVTLARLDSASERLSYLSSYVSVDDWLNLYSRHFITASSHYGTLLRDSSACGVNAEGKGYSPTAASDVTLSADVARETYNTQETSANYSEENIELLNRIVDLCKSRDVRLVFVVVPISNALLWKAKGMDKFYNWLSDYCQDVNCELYDLNLIKNRYTLFNDQSTFKDADHLGGIGAKRFTEALCDLVKKFDQGQSVSGDFYSSYSALKADSPYMQYIAP